MVSAVEVISSMDCWLVPRSTAKVIGRMPIRISMINPIPFCPSFDPWPKLTPVQVRISRPRIHSGGALSFSGAMYKSLRLIKAFIVSKSNAAAPNPTIGETSNDMPTSDALAQFTPSPNSRPAESIEFASPTPIIAPIRACELEAGRPKYHVPRFQMIADRSNAKTIANPAPDPTFNTSSTGSSASTPKATPPLDVKTPIRFQQPDQTTATVGFNVCV